MYNDPITHEIDDNLESIHSRFLKNRSQTLDRRFLGWYRAIVEETNDPLQFRRVRVRIPELHNDDVLVQDLPWAIPAPWMGGINAGSWTHPVIGDIVFVCFEKNHPYAPIYCAAADPTRRRMYSMWSIYTKSPQPINPSGEAGELAEAPQDFLEEYLPKDGRPMNTGIADRYGNFLNFSAYGFAPRKHMVTPASEGTDALAQHNYIVNKDQPKVNDPDLKYLTFGTKYGHLAIFGDQGYKWDNEFKGDFENDKKFEEDRYKYILKYFNEQEAKDRDQRRIDIRTRLGHKLEMRDVGWDMSRDGEYGDIKTIGNSKGRDERWIKIRTKGGHLLQMIDTGFDAQNDKFYKRLNKDEFGSKVDDEEELDNLSPSGTKTDNQGDCRMIRLVTRHGNTLMLDDRGSDPIDAEGKETPHGNGFLMRTRKGFQMQAVDKDQLDHFMIVSPKDQVLEINDRSQYVLLSTTQSEQIHTTPNVKSGKRGPIRERSIYVEKSGASGRPTSNTFHMVLDKQNCMIRLKDPEGGGIEIRGKGAPCGEWVEVRDKSNRALWFSDRDNWTVLRCSNGAKWLLLDDSDDVIVLRNEADKIQIRAKKNIELISDEGDICLKAKRGQIGIDAKEINLRTNGTIHHIQDSGIATRGDVKGRVFLAKPDGTVPCQANEKEIARKKPEDFPKERGCEDNVNQKGPVPTSVIISPPGGGGGGGSGLPNGENNPLDPPPPNQVDPPLNTPSVPTPPSPPPELFIDPISDVKGIPGGGVLWYGTTTKFLEEIEEFGLVLSSFSNNLNIPPAQDAKEIHLAKTLDVARGNTQAILAQQRYGERSLILRIRAIPDGSQLFQIEGNDDVLAFRGDLPFRTFIEVFEEGTVELTTSPLFP